MFLWILILGFWVVLLSLILHDATKDDDNGSAILIAAKGFRMLTGSVVLGARKLGNAGLGKLSQARVAARNVQVHALARSVEPELGSASSTAEPEPIRQSTPPVVEQASPSNPPPKKTWWRKDKRGSMTIPELELAIADAVRNAAPGCEGFVGVVVIRTPPKSRSLDLNWAIQGIKFGKADRKIAGANLTTIIEKMQQEVRLTEE